MCARVYGMVMVVVMGAPCSVTGTRLGVLMVMLVAGETPGGHTRVQRLDFRAMNVKSQF